LKKYFYIIAIFSLICFIFLSQIGCKNKSAEKNDSATQSNTNINIKYDVIGGQLIFDEKSGIIIGFTGEPTNITIPSDINGVNVTAIGDSAFEKCQSLNSVSLPDDITKIGKRAFSRTGLSEINIPEKIISIGDYAFSYCASLTKSKYTSKYHKPWRRRIFRVPNAQNNRNSKQCN